jgi:inorganic triphosphatase YgiF
MTTTHPQEIELKLTLPPEQAGAFLRRMARRRSEPLRQALVTRYYDTPDFALSAQGVALRVRRTLQGTSTLQGTRAGRRWLQTLKTEGERQGGLSRRVEFEMAVRRGALDWSRFPAEALAYVPEALRGQIAPVFETRFQRTAWLLKGRGGAQIEVALDVGEVRSGTRSQPLCEIELELKSGQPDALFALALEWAGAFGCLPFDISKAERGVRLAHGVEAAPVKSVPLVLAPRMSVGDAFAAIVQACLAQFQANLPGVLDSDDIEYVHQARVALRRLRAALRLFRRVCVLPDALLDDLRGLVGALGPARDWDVLHTEVLPAIAPHYTAPAAWQHGVDALEARRAEVRAAMRAALMQGQPGAWLLAMQRWLQQHGWCLSRSGTALPEAQRFAQLSPLKKWASRALGRGHRRVARGARSFATLQPLERHALRIAIKRQRYAAEFFQTLFGGSPAGQRRQAAYLAVLRDAQDSLGRANDAHIALGLLSAVQAEAGPMREFALGWLAAQVAGAGNGASAAHMEAFMSLKPYW